MIRYIKLMSLIFDMLKPFFFSRDGWIVYRTSKSEGIAKLQDLMIVF